MKRFAFAVLLLAGCSERDDGGTVTERVELITYRTEKRHEGCSGFLRVIGQPEKIDAYGIDKMIFTHVCSECGETNKVYDAYWPQFKREWRAVK